MQESDLGSGRMPNAQTESDRAAGLTRVQAVIDRALQGTLGEARDRAPLPHEPQVLGPQHINMILDRAAGFQLKEIAERWDYTPVQVANVLGSPDAQIILSTISSMQAGVLLSMEARFATLAPEALNTKVSIMRDSSVAPGVRDRVATDILDRAGYAPRQHSEIEHKHKVMFPVEVAVGLREVLAESKRAAGADYGKFLHKVSDDVERDHMQLEVIPRSADSASPIPSLAAGELGV